MQDQSFKSFNSMSKSNDEQNNSLMTNTINPNIAKLSFRVKYETKYGQSLYIIGSIEELGEWDPSKAVPMATSKDIYPTWKITKEFTCPIGMEISYKYIVKEGSNIYWEELNKDRRIVIQSPGNLIIFDEKSNNISKIKTMAYYPMNNNNPNLSNTTNILQNMLSNLSFNTGNNGVINYNNNFLTSNLYLASYQSLSSYQNKSIDFSNWKLTEGENEENNYFNNFSSKDITYEFVNEEDDLNNNIDDHLEILDLCQNIQQDDKIIIVTTFLPFVIERKDNHNKVNNFIDLNASENTNSINNINMKYSLSLNDDKLVNIFLYSLKAMNICNVYWVGMLRGLEDYPEKIQYEIFEHLANQKIYVVTPSKKELINFQLYVNQILYPLFNNKEIDINSHFYKNPETYYTNFLSVTKAFAETIDSNLTDSSQMIFINDIELAYLPNCLIRNNIKSNISLFIHSNFPNYSTLSLIHNNKDLLKSLLLCNTLGFHSFIQAKNFFDGVKIYFNANYKVRFDGLFFIEYMKREIPIFIRKSNIDINFLKNNVIKNYNNNSKIESDKKIINLLSFDSINNVFEIMNKLKIILEINLCNFLDYKYKLDLIIVKDQYLNKYLNEQNEKNEKIISDYMKIINDKLGADFNILFKISFVSFIPVKDQIKYFFNTDIFLLSDISLWNGMRTLVEEFIIVQNEIISKNKSKENEKIDTIKIFKDNINGNNNNNESKCEVNEKMIGLIISENMIVPEEFKLISKTNFNDMNIFKNTLEKIKNRSQDETIAIINHDLNQIKKSNTTIWIKDFLCELKKTMINNKMKKREKIEGYGLVSSYYPIYKNLRPLTQKNLPVSFQSSSIKLFLLDLNSIISMHLFSENYENDVVNYNINSDNKLNINNQNNINISNSLVDNNKKIINLLSILGNNKNNIIYLITNKSKDAFKELHLNPINFGFVAEEGFLIKPYGEQNFKTVFRTTNNNWKNTLIKLFSNFSRKIGDGTIIKKEYSISWIYNNSENNNNYMVGEELKFLVENIIDKTKFDINLDKNNLEVTIKNQNKFQYIFDIIQKIVADNKNFNLIFGLNNNDKYGEGFFEYLYNIEKDFKKNKRVINVFTSVIGKKTTKAKYFFKDITDFIDILKVFDIKK